VAARNQLLRQRGHHAARELANRLDAALREQVPPPRDDDDDDFESGGSR
jgi:hypothetical protein